MDSNFQVKITADLKELEASLKQVDKLLNNVSTSSAKAGSATSTATKAATTDAKAMAEQLKAVQAEANRARMVSFAFGQVLRDSGFFAQSFGLGLLAISNNIPVLIDQLITMAKVTGAAANAISIAGSVLTAALTIYAYYAQSVKDANAEYVKSMAEAQSSAKSNIATINSLVAVAKNEELSYSERNQAIKELNKQYPELNNQLTVNNISTKESIALLNKLTEATELHAKAQALAKLIGAEYEAQFKAMNNTVDGQASIFAKAGAVILQAFGQNAQAAVLKTASGVDEFSKTINSTQQNAQKYQNELNNVNSRLAKLGLLHKENAAAGKTVSDVYAELAIELKQITATVNNSFKEDAAARVKAYQKAIDELIKLGVNPASDSIKNLQQLVSRFDLAATLGQGVKTDPMASIIANQEAGVKKMIGNAQLLGTAYKDLGVKIKQIDSDVTLTFSEKNAEKIKVYQQAIDFLIKNGFDPAGIAVKQFQTAIEGLQEPAEKVNEWGQYIIQTIGGDLVNAFNTMLTTGTLSFGGVMKAIGNMIKKLIAAAIAALILVSILQSLGMGGGLDFKKTFGMLSGLQLGGGSGGGGQTPFAEGGIVSGPTSALVGEYPGAKSNPEVIAPLDKLQSMIANTGGGQMSGVLETRISGNDLVILMNKATKNRNSYF